MEIALGDNRLMERKSIEIWLETWVDCKPERFMKHPVDGDFFNPIQRDNQNRDTATKQESRKHPIIIVSQYPINKQKQRKINIIFTTSTAEQCPHL